MDCLPKNSILEMPDDALAKVREEVGLDKPGEMKKAVSTLREWIEKQPHIKEKSYPDIYLETSIVATKGSVERTKKRFDKMCTMRTLLPHFFDTHDIKELAIPLSKSMYLVMLPRLTKEHNRVIAYKFTDVFPDSSMYMKYFKFCIHIAEYMKCHDYFASFHIVIDMTQANIMDFLSKVNISEIRQITAIFTDGYGLRVKGIHFITQSRAIDGVVSILKTVLKPKLSERITVHKKKEDVLDIIGADVLPTDFGGNERPMKQLFDEWVEVMSTKENKEFMKFINSASTDESLRIKDEFNNDYAGLPGTFRILSVD